MKSIAPSGYFRFYISLFFFISLTFHAQAHDPGLSSARVTVGNQQIDVLLDFAQRDVEFILAAVTNSADTDTSKGFAPIQLESVATNEFSLYWGKQRAIPNQTTARREDAQNIEISLRFQRPNSEQVRLVSTLFERLPMGHREFLSVQTTRGAILGEVMLSAKENSLQIDLPAVAVSTADSNKSYSL